MSVSTVEKLIEQRRLFQDWLTKLAADVEGMPPHVVERVRNDYRARLEGVVSELGEHADSLRDALDEARLRHDGLDAQQQAKKDELAELRLRRHVGEMDDPTFKDQSGVMKAALEGIQKEVSAALRDIERYEEILEIIAADSVPASAPEPEPEPEPEPAPPPPPPVAAAPAPPPAPEPPREPRKSSPDVAKGGDELAFLRSVTSVPVIPALKVAPRAAEKPAPREEKPVRQEKPAAVAEEESEPFEAAPSLLKMPMSEHDEPVAATAPAAAPAKPAAREDAALVCGECGATNRPTEWYCEKCGAELAAF